MLDQTTAALVAVALEEVVRESSQRFAFENRHILIMPQDFSLHFFNVLDVLLAPSLPLALLCKHRHLRPAA